MDFRDETNHFFNIKFAKLTGLYQMLDPKTIKFRGRNIYHMVMACVLAYLCFISIILMLSEFTSFLIYKMWFVVRHSNDIWNCLSITWYDFTSLRNRNRYILDLWRGRLSWFTAIYATIYLASTASYLAITLAFSGDKSPVKNHDGSIGYYRQNAMNLYLIVSDETYNAHYYMFYLVEALFVTFIGLLFFIFDFLLVTLRFSVCCQMQIICSAFESVGHKSLVDRNCPIDYTVENIKISPNEHDLVYDELKTIIMDHQLVMKIYEDFSKLFRRVMLLHIFVSSISVIALCFTLTMSFSNDERFKTSEVIVKKMFCLIPPILFQIYMVCSLFGNIHDQNDEMIFAMYSSNWTEMDMKCKKLILLTMKLNNANHKKLKFTRTKIVNLEMFFKTMGNCYTVVSVLVNYIK